MTSDVLWLKVFAANSGEDHQQCIQDSFIPNRYPLIKLPSVVVNTTESEIYFAMPRKSKPEEFKTFLRLGMAAEDVLWQHLQIQPDTSVPKLHTNDERKLVLL